ncbi:hypothetical protein [Luethyella okanaganae]|uniref:Uncharacterized protein n=1 Tax=Luethyella okanaganae TaxID=69372 RepID=A0ABW1VJV2_9MICO
MIRILVSALIGAAVAGAVAWILSADEAWTGLVVTTAIAAGVLTPLVLVARSASGVFGAESKPEDIQLARSEGRLALARVLAIARTGTSINDQPLCDIDLLVMPRFGSPYQVRTRRLVDIVEIPRLQPECVVVVALAQKAPSAVAIVMNPPDDWAVQALSDQAVRTTRSAPVWVPQASAANTSRLRRIPVWAYGFGLLAGAALALIPAYPIMAQLVNGETTLDEVRSASGWEGRQAAEEAGQAEAAAEADIFVGDNARRQVDALVEKVGPFVTSLSFWRADVAASAPTTPGAQTVDRFSVSAQTVTRDGADSTQPEPGELVEELFDATAVDYGIMGELITVAHGLSGIDPSESSDGGQWVYLDKRPIFVNGETQTMLTFDVPVDGEYYNAWITFDTGGNVLSMRGGAPGSASYLAEHPAG